MVLLTLANKQLEIGLIQLFRDLFRAELERRGVDYTVRFEARGEEFISVARLKQMEIGPEQSDKTYF